MSDTSSSVSDGTAAETGQPSSDGAARGLPIPQRSQSDLQMGRKIHRTLSAGPSSGEILTPTVQNRVYGATTLENERIAAREQALQNVVRARMRRLNATNSPFQSLSPALTPRMAAINQLSAGSGAANERSLGARNIGSPLDLVHRTQTTKGGGETTKLLVKTSVSTNFDQSGIAGANDGAVLGTVDGDGEFVVGEQKLSSFNAGFAILNLFLGLALLSYPYAIAQGGLVSIPILGIVCIGACFTGKLIVRCFASPLVPYCSYPKVGDVAFESNYNRGWIGETLISVGVMMEFIGASIISCVFIEKNLKILLPDGWFNDIELCLLIFAITVPSVLILDFSSMTIHSMIGFICKACVVFMVVFTYFYTTDEDKEQVSNGGSTIVVEIWPDSLSSLSVSIGIFILSLAGHPCLPEVYNKMSKPEEFETVLNVCFVIMFVLYSFMGTLGYLQFGRDGTSAVITESLADLGDSSSDSVFNLVLKIMIALVTLGCYSSIIPIIAVMSQIPEFMLGIEDMPRKQRMFRVSEVFAVMCLTYLFLDHLPFVEAICGSMFTMITSVICPPLFFYLLQNAPLTAFLNVDPSSKPKPLAASLTGLLIFLIIFGVLFGVVLVINDIKGIIDAPINGSA